VYTHGSAVPVQSVYVQVYVFVPPQAGSGLTTGPVGVMVAPQEFVTGGGTGTVCALVTQGTEDPPGAGTVNVGGLIVYVNTYCTVEPVQLV